MDPHRLAELRSLAYHRVVAERLRRDPAVLGEARARVHAWVSQGTSPHYGRRWEQVLAGPVDAVCATLVDEGEDATALRQATPFAGVLSPRERWRIWDEERRRVEGR